AKRSREESNQYSKAPSIQPYEGHGETQSDDYGSRQRSAGTRETASYDSRLRCAGARRASRSFPGPAPGREARGCPARDSLLRCVPLRHPYGAQRVEADDVPRRSRSRNRWPSLGSRKESHEISERRSGRRRGHGRLVSTLRQLPERSRTVLYDWGDGRYV